MSVLWRLAAKIPRLLINHGLLDAVSDEPRDVPMSRPMRFAAKAAFYFFHGGIGGLALYGLCGFFLKAMDLGESALHWLLASSVLLVVLLVWFGWTEIE